MNLNDLTKINTLAVKVIREYQNIPFGNLTINTPYFINLAESVYKDVFRTAGAGDKTINAAIHQIKGGKTPLGSNGGKETPKQIEQSLMRMSDFLLSRDYNLQTKSTYTIREWMKIFHIGIDCSGFVFNVLHMSFSPTQWALCNKLLSWKDPTRKEASRAGVFVFNSPKLAEVTDLRSLHPLDLCIYSNNSHLGLLVDIDNELYLAESSIGADGITTKRIRVDKKGVVSIERGDSWNKALKSKDIIIRRLT